MTLRDTTKNENGGGTPPKPPVCDAIYRGVGCGYNYASIFFPNQADNEQFFAC